MTLLQKIKADQLEARKTGSKESASLLTTLYSEASLVGFNDHKRESTDAEVIATIKKFLKNINLCLQSCTDSQREHYLFEKSLLESYLPQQITGEELRTVMLMYVEQNGGIKEKSVIMRNLKAQFAGRYDGNEAAKMFDEI